MSRLDNFGTNADDTPALPPSLRKVSSRRAPVLDAVFPLLLALADDELATPVIQMALALAQAKGAVPTVIRAIGESRVAEIAVDPLVGTVVEEFFGPEYRDGCRNALQTQVTSTAGPVGWRVEITDQSPIDSIVEQARQLRAGLIVMGLRHHGVMQRAISRDLLGEVVKATGVPVLAVRPGGEGLPSRVVVAIDFKEASIRAARMACRLLSDDGQLYLVHVAPHNSDQVRAQLDAVVEELSPAPGMTITSVFLHGDVQSSIECYAQAVAADLLVVGSDDHSLMDRLLTSRVSMRLAHTARWSTLIVPSRNDD